MTASTARPLRRDAAENRQRLLDAASQVFAENGLSAGVDEVARVAGVGTGTLYRRFPTKQALIDALVGQMRLRMQDIARKAARLPDGSGLEVLLVGTGELQALQSGCLRSLWNHSDAESDALAEFRLLLAELLRRGQDAGRIRADATATDISMVLWSLGGVIESSGPVAPHAWRRHLELLIAGLRPAARDGLSAVLKETPLTQDQFLRATAAAART
ncbi:TetR/AcrR family transcriptional regulator [Jatrophihabitans sp. DSM 45814]